MAPKKAVKKQKEEVIEIPKTSTIPDGKRTHFIGGWSAHTGLQALDTITQDKDSGDRVVLLPGTFNEADTVVAVRALVVEGATEAQLAPVPVAAAAPEGEEENGEGDAAAAEGGEEEDVKKAAAEPIVDTSVVIAGRLTLERWIPPVEVKAPTPVVEEPKKPEPKGKAAKDKAKKAQEKEEEAPPPPPAEVVEEAPKGANPAEWPTLTLRNVTIDGTLVVKGIHATLENCHFTGVAAHQLQVHQYSRVVVSRSTFSSAHKSGAYVFPCGHLELVGCVVSGGDTKSEQQATRQSDAGDAAGDAQARVRDADALAQSANSVGVYCDDGTITVKECAFRKLSIGVLMRDACAGSLVAGNTFSQIYSTGVFLDGATVTFQDNQVRKCHYYGLRVARGNGAKILRNKLESKVLIERGARPLLHTNECAVRLEDRNDTGVPYLEPAY